MRPEKQSIISEIRSQLESSSFVIFTDYTKVKVAQAGELRKRLSKVEAQFHVVKNSYFTKASAGLSWGASGVAMVGPTAIVVGKGDGVEAAKIVKGFGVEAKALTIRRGVFEGRLLSREDIDALVKLPGRPVLYAMVLGTMAAPMTQLVGVMVQKVSSLLYVLKAAQEKKEKSQQQTA